MSLGGGQQTELVLLDHVDRIEIGVGAVANQLGDEPASEHERPFGALAKVQSQGPAGAHGVGC